jgi:hypothetical protein
VDVVILCFSASTVFPTHNFAVQQVLDQSGVFLSRKITMPRKPWLIECDKPSYHVLKWIGGFGFGQVFKVLRNGQVRDNHMNSPYERAD